MPRPRLSRSLLAFCSATFWGYLSDRIGRRWAMILPALIAIPLAPFYLFTDSFIVMAVAFTLQGFAGTGGMFAQIPSYLNERFPTEVRATATAFCFHQGAIFGGSVAPTLTFLAALWGTSLAIPMFLGTRSAAPASSLRCCSAPRPGAGRSRPNWCLSDLRKPPIRRAAQPCRALLARRLGPK
jgi:SHS family lactate transporter-like MFS transporter